MKFKEQSKLSTTHHPHLQQPSSSSSLPRHLKKPPPRYSAFLISPRRRLHFQELLAAGSSRQTSSHIPTLDIYPAPDGEREARRPSAPATITLLVRPGPHLAPLDDTRATRPVSPSTAIRYLSPPRVRPGRRPAFFPWPSQHVPLLLLLLHVHRRACVGVWVCRPPRIFEEDDNKKMQKFGKTRVSLRPVAHGMDRISESTAFLSRLSSDARRKYIGARFPTFFLRPPLQRRMCALYDVFQASRVCT